MAVLQHPGAVLSPRLYLLGHEREKRRDARATAGHADQRLRERTEGRRGHAEAEDVGRTLLSDRCLRGRKSKPIRTRYAVAIGSCASTGRTEIGRAHV